MITDKELQLLIDSLKKYRDQDMIYDPWVFSDGTIIEPLDVALELQEWRRKTRPNLNVNHEKTTKED